MKDPKRAATALCRESGSPMSVAGRMPRHRIVREVCNERRALTLGVQCPNPWMRLDSAKNLSRPASLRFEDEILIHHTIETGEDMRNRSKLLIAAASIATLVFTAAPAYAEGASSGLQVSESCWAELQPDGAKTPAPSTSQLCVDGTEEDLLEALADRNILVADASSEGRAEVNQAQEKARAEGAVAARATYILARVWQDANFSNRSYLFTTNVGSGCSSHAFSINDLGAYYYSGLGAWSLNNSISSVQSASPCKTWLYNDVNTTGSQYLVSGDSATLSWMNDLASSIRFTG